ncbi:hypothetical protein BHE74_00032202 [Ensete ventricosum]|nr:hypothetical protein GW17_00024318 [Ensete ventricosum]RWW60773.1 hypothetical protein BHE74_00032202 [Ensete ventricosum]
MLPLHVSIFYIDSFHAGWILQQVPPKLLWLSICIELMVNLMPTIPWISPPSNLIFISTLNVSSYDVSMVAPPLDLAMHPLIHYLIRDHAVTPRYSLDPLSFVEILC